jgi:phage terminase large subunit-like protein
VVSRKIPANGWVRKSCQRHLDDLVKSRSKDYVYKFDSDRAEHACVFIEALPHVKGQWARKRPGISNNIVLQPWQIFIVCSLFGWIHKINGLRRFTEAYIKVPRKNGKSILAAAIALYMLVADGEYGAEVYSGATKEKQAWEVFRPALQMVKKTPELQEYFGIECAAKSIYRDEDGSRMEPVVGTPGDGSSPSCAVNDEYHEHETAILHDTMQTGMGAREQPLLLNITTAGSLIDGPCHLLEQDCEKVLGGLIENDNLFCVMFGIDLETDWKSRDALIMANPNFGISVFADFLERQQRDAIQSAHKQNVFKTKHLNVWVNAATAWMNMDAWRKCADATLRLEDFAHKQCWSGNDLGAKIDLASRCRIFRELRGTEVHYFAFWTHYVPKGRAFDGEHQHYEKWVHEGWMVAHDGVEIKLERVQEDIIREFGRFDDQFIAFDPWSALQMQQNLEARFRGEIILTVDQSTKMLSEPMKEVEAAVLAGRFHHNGDPVASWAMSNVIAKEDANENIFPRKEKHGKNKIDPISALLTGMNRAMLGAGKTKSVYEERGAIVI